jgi:hypothetical protein
MGSGTWAKKAFQRAYELMTRSRIIMWSLLFFSPVFEQRSFYSTGLRQEFKPKITQFEKDCIGASVQDFTIMRR